MSSTHVQCALSEAPSHRSYFHVGGHYRNTGAGESQHVMTGQMYVEKLIPVDGVKHPLPLVFIHGAGQTGSVSPISSSLLACCSVACITQHEMAACQGTREESLAESLKSIPSCTFTDVPASRISSTRPMVAKVGRRGCWTRAT